MLNYFAKKIFGSSNDRVLKKFYPIVEKINSLEKVFSKLLIFSTIGKNFFNTLSLDDPNIFFAK